MATNRRNQENVNDSNNLVMHTVKDFIADNGFVQINNKVGVNKNDYPFVTFIDADNKAFNVYFAVKDAGNYISEETVNGKTVVIGDDIDNIKEFFADLYISDNGDTSGERPRYKLCTAGNSKRLSLTDLL